MIVIKYKKIWYLLSALLIAASLWAMYGRGLNLSIDFKGGTITEVNYTERPAKEIIEEKINQTGVSIRASGDNNYVIRTKEPLDTDLGGQVIRQNTIGPVAGAELQSRALKAIIVVVVMIVLFITFAFRKVSKPVNSWKYGLATIIALAHDVVIPTGIFIFLGNEIDLLFVTGLLAILGYSVHDSIVVFDRVRENLRLNREGNFTEEFETTVGKSVNQTFTRSINTSATIFITLLALYIFGPATTQNFSLLLTLGVIIGTYSSIFIASPLLVTFYKLQRK